MKIQERFPQIFKKMPKKTEKIKQKIEEKKTLVLLDSHAIIHRAYHALPDFASSKGEPTGALYGLSTMLLRMIELFKPDYIAACFDLPKPTYRHEAYEAYKAGRKKADPELVSQLIKSKEIFEAFSIPCFELGGFEADDLLGTIVEKLKKRDDVNIIIASGDMDTMQLIEGDKVRVFTLKKGIKDTITYNEKDVVERFGFSPRQLTDYKGLRGDPSDNIIGIAGIGEKTATALIKEFGTIEEMYKALKGKSGAVDRFKKAGISERMLELIKNNEEEALFSKMLATIRRDAPIDFALPKESWRESVSPQKVKAIFSDLDFRSLGGRVDVVLGGSQGNVEESGQEDKIAQKETEKIDPEEFKKTAIALWLLNSNITNPTLDDILNFGHSNSSGENFSDATKTILNEIEKRGLKKVYEEIELPLIPILEKMKEKGVKIDPEFLKELSKKYHKTLADLEKKIWKMVGYEFNIASPKQLAEALFIHLALKAKNQKKTAGGALSTKESELEKLRDLHPSIPLILEHRELSKLLGTYVDLLPTFLKGDGRIHPTFIQTGAATGRMASTEPAVQNIPVKSELGRNIRHAFIAEKDFVLVAFDYSQIELRIAAMLSEDKNLIEIFKTGSDAHQAVAAKVFGVALDKVDSEMRRKAKVINFGILYGMGVNALKTNLGGTRDEAQEFYNHYFQTFVKLAEYLDQTKASALRLGYTTTMYGRRRYFEGIKSHLPFIRAAAERMAINAPIQGTQADIVKIAMKRVDDYLKKEKLEDKVFMLLQVHDELIFEMEKSVAEKVSKKIKNIMEGVMDDVDTKDVPIVVHEKVGKDWGSLKEI